MSGRAGRRGKDERGICIIMIDEKVCLITFMLYYRALHYALLHWSCVAGRLFNDNMLTYLILKLVFEVYLRVLVKLKYKWRNFWSTKKKYLFSLKFYMFAVSLSIQYLYIFLLIIFSAAIYIQDMPIHQPGRRNLSWIHNSREYRRGKKQNCSHDLPVWRCIVYIA